MHEGVYRTGSIIHVFVCVNEREALDDVHAAHPAQHVALQEKKLTADVVVWLCIPAAVYENQ